MKIGEILIKKGEKKKFKTGQISGVIFCGKNEGKTLVITAGVHGCEYVGIETSLRLINELNPKKMSGNIIICPILNADGFYNGVKQISTADGKNLNREFPGDKEGTITQKIAHDVEKYLYPLADFIVDLHGGDINESLTPLIFFPYASGEEIKSYVGDIASRMNVDFRVGSYANNGLYSYAAKKKVPAMLYERGSKGLWSEVDVLAEKEDLYRLMEMLGILKEGYDVSINKNQKEIVKAEYVEARSEGLWYPHVKQSDNVKKGELLGILKDIEGDILQEVRAEFDARVLYYTLSLGVRQNDALIAYGRE